jgi:putative transposase
VRQKALVIAYAVHETGVREGLGIDVGEAETEAFWTEFLFSLKARDLAGVRLCVSDAHQCLERDRPRVGLPLWQRSTVHFLRDMLGHCGRSQQPMIATAIRQIFNTDSGDEARERLAEVVDRLQTPAAKVAGLLEQAEEELLAFYSFPREHWPKLRPPSPLERVNKEIGRRSDVVGIHPNDRGLIRLAGMLLIEQNDKLLVQRRYLSDHSIRLALSAERNENSAPTTTNTRRSPPSTSAETRTSQRRSGATPQNAT